jgi:glycosyltransferase involved in cell wall biosynthesis
MKVIIVGTAFPFRGGLAAYNERLALEYVKQGNEVEIYTFTVQYPAFLFPGKTQYSTEAAPENLNIFRKVNSVNPFNWLKVGLEIKNKKPDLVLIKFWLPFMAPCLGTISRIARLNKKTKVVSVLDNIIPHEKRFGDRMFASYFVHSVDGFVAMSKSVLNDVELFDKYKPKVFCPHPLYDNFGEKLTRKDALKKINLDESYRYMLFFGFVRDYKGLDLLLKAFADSRLKELNLKLIVAGEFYNNSEQYFALEEELELKGKILWYNDFIPDSEVKNFFCAADIIVQPYKTATQSGVSQIAYHFEKPMLVTNVGGLAEIIPDGKVGYVVEVELIQIANALVDFFANERSEKMIENIKIEKKKFLWSRMTDAIDGLFKI